MYMFSAKRCVPLSHSSIAITVVVTAALFAWLAGPFAVKLYENTAFSFFPSPPRAAHYGEKHFNAGNPALYDIDRAEYFYAKVAMLDPSYPYVNHQLARISFLRGNFSTALFYINKEIALHGKDEPNSYYVRGLIEGYMGKYADAAKDYEHFLKNNPHNWAAINDYAWVLLKANRFDAAAGITAYGLTLDPNNPWLLNSYATASFELGHDEEALAAAKKAQVAVLALSEKQWLTAYPGNDPKIAQAGIASFKKAVSDNVHSIELAIASSTVQPR